MDVRIVTFYKLAAVTDPRIHTAANSIDAKIIIGERDLSSKFVKRHGALVPNETVIGGGTNTEIPYRRKPIIVI